MIGGYLGAVLALVLAFMAPVFVGSASAHSQLIAGDPKDGTAIEKAPSAITLTFNEDLENLPGSKSNQIVVRDRDGKEVTTGAVKVDGTKLTRSLTKLPAGTYDVQWSALSADGHRVSGDGNYAFTVTKGEKPAPTMSKAPTSTAPSTSQAAKPGAESASAAATSSQAATTTKNDPAGTVTIMWIVGGFLVLAIILGIILQVTRKKTPKDH
jgi:methionine-rich copper-binding protein CopC